MRYNLFHGGPRLDCGVTMVSDVSCRFQCKKDRSTLVTGDARWPRGSLRARQPRQCLRQLRTKVARGITYRRNTPALHFLSLSLSSLYTAATMKLLSLLPLLPLALSAPTSGPASAIPEMTVSQWSGIQSSFVDGVRSLGSWSWSTAGEIISELEGNGNGDSAKTTDDSQETIWQQLKADPHSFSKLVKIIEVSERSIPFCPIYLVFSFTPSRGGLTLVVS